MGRKLDPKKPAESFGERLRRIRETRGFSQEQLCRHTAITQRMLSYYENHAEKAPAKHLMKLAAALHVSIDELIGYQPFPEAHVKRNSRLWHRLRSVETLPPKDKKQVLHFIQSLVEKESLRQANGRV